MAIEMADPWWEPSLFGWPLWAVLCLSVLSVVCFAVQWLDVPEKAAADQTTPKFRSFQRNYLAIYLIIFLADWLQGTNMHTLYMVPPSHVHCSTSQFSPRASRRASRTLIQ